MLTYNRLRSLLYLNVPSCKAVIMLLDSALQYQKYLIKNIRKSVLALEWRSIQELSKAWLLLVFFELHSNHAQLRMILT